MNMILGRIRQRSRAAVAGLAAIYVLSQVGCGPTYPKEIVDEAIVQLCKEEYALDVKVKIIGNTVGVYIPIENLFDNALAISGEAAEKINDVLLSVSRVTLSTDAALNFYIVIAQDPILPEVEVILIRYVRDIKMLHFNQISRGEFGRRMIIDIKLTPQAQKEKVLRGVFDKLNISKADEFIQEYLRTSEVSTIGDIGYWNDIFYMKDIGMGEFLSLQIADRIKGKFITDDSLKESYRLTAIKGEFLQEGGRSFFRFSINAQPLNIEAMGLESEGGSEVVFETAVQEIADVIHGYKYDAFWNVEVVDMISQQVLFAAQQELEDFRKKRINVEELRRWYR
ncbi:MAG: hypothetical protein HQ575_02535 [Candidatus Omnitrophica bacterium]|nr:hypothetical protein [Candidatus Omnitrophota bacterium]